MKLKDWKPTPVSAAHCVMCQVAFTHGETQADMQEIVQTQKGPAHTDCYYGAMSQGIEESPIASGSIRRG